METNVRVVTDIPATIEFFQRQYERYKDAENPIHAQLAQAADMAVVYLYSLIFKQMHNTGIILGIKPNKQFMLEQAATMEQLQLPFHDAKQVEDLKEIKKNVQAGEDEATATHRVDNRNIEDCKKLWNDYIAQHPDILKGADKNDILVKMFNEMEESKRFDPFDAIRRIVYRSYCANSRTAMLVTADNILNGKPSKAAEESAFAVPEAKWSQEELIRFCAQSIFIHKEKLKDLAVMMNPLTEKPLGEKTATIREAEVLHNKKSIEVRDEIWKIEYSKINIKEQPGETLEAKRAAAKAAADKATEDILESNLTETRREVLALTKEFNKHYSDPYRAAYVPPVSDPVPADPKPAKQLPPPPAEVKVEPTPAPKEEKKWKQVHKDGPDKKPEQKPQVKKEAPKAPEKPAKPASKEQLQQLKSKFDKKNVPAKPAKKK